MLVIRFQRIGKKKQAAFRVVLQERAWKPQGKIKELLGFYSPHSKEKKFQAERVKYWLAKGAQPSPTVQNLFVDAGITEGPKVKAWRPKKRKSSDLPTEASAKAGASAEEGEKSEPAAKPAEIKETVAATGTTEAAETTEEKVEVEKTPEPEADKPATA